MCSALMWLEELLLALLLLATSFFDFGDVDAEQRRERADVR